MAGYCYLETQIKEDAKEIDNVTKFAWDDNDYKTVQKWHEYTEEELEELKQMKLEKSIPELIAEQDDAICALFEENLNFQTRSDELDDTICSLYEMMVGE